MEGFVLVTAEGGLISEVVFYEEKEPAVRMAEMLAADGPEADDLKVFDLEEHIVWNRRRKRGVGMNIDYFLVDDPSDEIVIASIEADSPKEAFAGCNRCMNRTACSAARLSGG